MWDWQGLPFGHAAPIMELWFDAKLAACTDTRRRTTSRAATVYGGAVAWGSLKQPTSTASTTDAEYQVCAVAREALSLHNERLLRGFSVFLYGTANALWCVTIRRLKPYVRI